MKATAAAVGIGAPSISAIRRSVIDEANWEDSLACSHRTLDDGVAPTAIFAASDSIALGVLAEAHRRGLRVPQDLSVVGFDGTSNGALAVPRLTSVAQPLFDMGASALRSVLRLSRGERIDANHIEFETKLIVRESTAPPAAMDRAKP
ncbi:substrate-binding domain-containing protein [Cryobacterium sp. PH29-G1]|nr:substrate-binding domain-containing protein [Cryobacterium sp. PH29-G1]MDJ0350091.1 substrate-binding domain-containing protein [Cryobacterium sp. PH29-G1]